MALLAPSEEGDGERGGEGDADGDGTHES